MSKICILTSYTDHIRWDNYGKCDYGDFASLNHHEYSNKHGYSYVKEIVKNDDYSDWHPTWIKIDVLKKYLPLFDYVVWIDADAVFVNHTDGDQIKKLKAAGIKVVVMPEEPVDQIIGMMLYSKISAVMEGHMLVRGVMISSTAGDSVVYEHDNTESAAPFDQPGWWNSTDPHCEMQTKRNPEKVFVITASNQWRDLGLEWVDNNKPSEDGNVLVFTEFKKNEDK